MSNIRRMLVIGPAWVGDMVMAQTLFRLLKQREPDIQLDVLAPAWTKPLLDRMPEVNQALASPFGHGQLHLYARYQLGKSLKLFRYDQAIVLPNSFKSALIPYWAKIPRRTGWVGECRFGILNDIRFLDKNQWPLMIEQFMALALEKTEKLPAKPLWPALTIAKDSVAQSLQALQISSLQEPVLALCPGAEFGAAKRWPAEYYAEVAKVKLAQGWQVWLFGSLKDKFVTDQIEALTDHRVLNLAGKTSLTQAIDLLSQANLVVSNDSGLMHVAAALSRPLVVIYGSTSPQFTPPLTDQVKILKNDLACSPCFKRECPLQHFKCMQDLKPGAVIEAMQF